MDNSELIYNYLLKSGFSPQGACGILGNLHAESACRPENLQNSGNKKLGMTDTEYTAAVDNGKYDNFVHDGIGYGLCQWTYWSRKQGLLTYAKTYDKSIADLEMQLCFMIRELSQYGILDQIKCAETVDASTRIFMLQYEKPANQSEENIQTRIGYSNVYFSKYVNSLDADLSILCSHGVISSPEYWRKTAPNVTYLPELIHNMAEALR